MTVISLFMLLQILMRTVHFLETIGVQEVYVLERLDRPLDSERRTELLIKAVQLSVVKASLSSE